PVIQGASLNEDITQMISPPSEQDHPGNTALIEHRPPSHKPEVPGIVESEKKLVEKALQATGNNKTQAAKLLGISREGLRKKIKRLF
ncbi:MAG: helix-turn-helix domain-containing protein, partial [Desulfonatronovibrio sp.]